MGYHNECAHPVDDLESIYVLCCCSNKRSLVPIIIGERALKANEDIKDVLSTGRKRAALLKPITSDTVCEWSGLKFAGGGVEPIIGCLGNKATDRHHGPDKNTLNNELDNLHVLCSTCHNRWHANNNKHYGLRPEAGQPFLPLEGQPCKEHNSDTKATPEEIFLSEVKWQQRADKREKEKEDGRKDEDLMASEFGG